MGCTILALHFLKPLAGNSVTFFSKTVKKKKIISLLSAHRSGPTDISVFYVAGGSWRMTSGKWWLSWTRPLKLPTMFRPKLPS